MKQPATLRKSRTVSIPQPPQRMVKSIITGAAVKIN